MDRTKIIAKLMSDYKDELEVLSDHELIIVANKMTEVKNLSDKDWDEIRKNLAK